MNLERYLTLALIIALSLACFKFYRDLELYKGLALEAEIKALQELVERNSATNKALLGRLEALAEQSKLDKVATAEVRKEAQGLTPKELKTQIGGYVTRGLAARGVR